MESFIYLERYVNNGSPSGFNNTTSKDTAPLTGKNSFPLLEFKDFTLETFTVGEDNPIFKSRNFAHPDSISSPFLKASGRILKPSKFIVSPTASGRTMLLQNENINGFLKLSYDVSMLGRDPRLIPLSRGLMSLGKTQVIKEAIDKQIMPPYFAFLPETSFKTTLLPYKDKKIPWTTIYRELNPYPNKSNLHLVPAFALFSKDHNHPDEKPLIIKLIQESGINPETYLSTLLKITIDSYFALVLNLGLYAEMHAQNTLFEVDNSGNVVRLVLRDMEDIYHDSTLDNTDYSKSPFRTKQIMDYLETAPESEFLAAQEIDASDKERHLMYSFFYDFKLGEYLLEPIINTVSSEYHLNPKSIRKSIKKYVRDTYQDELEKDYFPSEWYSLKLMVHHNEKNQDDDFQKHFIKNRNPKFR